MNQREEKEIMSFCRTLSVMR